MGVRQLTGFVRRHSQLHEERLSGCPLVIDGSNLYWELFERLRNTTGGVYQMLTRQLETFFYDLKRCNVSPIVFIDGTYNSDCQRLPALLQHMRTEIKQTLKKANAENAEIQCCKTLLRTIFIEVLQRMGVPYAVCIFEADLPAAAMARRLNCPIMTNDSDFFTLGVTSVQIPKRRAALELRHPSPGHTSYFMTCEVFRPQRFLERFNVAEEMMPLIATLPGNDEFPPSLFDEFFEQLQEQEKLKRLEIIMRWLATQTSLELALKKVLQYVCEEERERLEQFIVTFNSTVVEISLDFLQDTATMVFPADVALAEGSATSTAVSAGSPASPGFLKPPALRQSVARGAVLARSINAVYGLPWRLKPNLEDPLLPCSSRAAVPLLARLSALLGAPVGPLMLFTMYERELHQLLASCTWRAPLLERVLLGGTASCRQAALATLQLSPGALASLPPLLQLPAAALVTWRRATAGRSGRRQVRAVLLCLLALTPDSTPASKLGLSPAAAAGWRTQVTPLRFAGMKPAWFNLTVMHLYNELQGVYEAVLSLNDVLGRPLAQLDVEHTLHAPMTMRLGFISCDQGGEVEAGAEVEALVSTVTDTIEAEVCRWQDTGDDKEGSATDSVPWRPSSRQDTSSEHPDLRTARTLTGVLNKMADDNATRMRETLRGLSVKTEYGLYTLVDTVYRRAMAEPSEVSRCADVCSVLADMQVKSERGGGKMVRFGDLLLTRLFLGIGPVCRWPLCRSDILKHLDTEPDPAARWHQFGQLTDAWREAERRQLVCLQLLAAVVQRHLVPVWAARRCLQRYLGGDGETSQPPEGVMRLDKDSFVTTWSRPTLVVKRALLELLQWCNSDVGSG